MTARASLRLGAVLIASSLVLIGCMTGTTAQVVGAGELTTESRPVADFTGVDLSGGLLLDLTIGSPTSLAVVAQPNLLPITTTTVSNGKLMVRTTSSFQTFRGITIKVTVPSLTDLSVSGGTVGSAKGLAAQELRVNADSGAVLTLSGSATTLALVQTAGAVLNGSAFTATNASVQLDSGAIATFNATGAVTGSAANGAMLNLRGTPTSVNVTTSGGALVTR